MSAGDPSIRRRDLLRGAWVATAAVAVEGLSLGAPGAAAQSKERLRIGIIGAGQIGGTLGEHWVKAGHEVLLS
jgi:hypothetical protein